MKKICTINDNWIFTYSKDDSKSVVNLPHTWNYDDGQDGDGKYYRCEKGACSYEKQLDNLELAEGDQVYLEFKGVNASAKVFVNASLAGEHDGGYSAFRVNITPYLQKENIITVEVENTVNDRVYPQFADFTFYGGIYRDVNLIQVGPNHFDLDYFGCNPIKIEPTIGEKDKDGKLKVTTWVTGEGDVSIAILDAEGNTVCTLANGEETTIENVHRWDGTKDPYMYKAVATLTVNGEAVDEVSAKFGFRSFSVDRNTGFYLNGRSYPLHGVSRHQDRPGMARTGSTTFYGGNALTKAEHDEDMAMIKEIGANTIRLAHYQHADYFYDLCDEAGMVVWAEVPYISRHMNNGDDNIKHQFKELIIQQFNHPSIMFWGVSNEITMKKTDNKHMLQAHKEMNDMAHELDPSRLTTLACFAMCMWRNKVARITDVVSWNLYLGWYVPGKWLNRAWMAMYRFLDHKHCIGMSEYGAEGMINLHKEKVKRMDNTEKYQAKYHEYMLEFFAKHPFFWSTHVWNMFDFAADGRNQGGDPGMNHKGLVTFDRKIKKDAFYLYKAYWSDEPVLHLCGKRYENREKGKTEITVYTNQGAVEIYNNGQLVATPKPKYKSGKVFSCKIKVDKSKDNVIVVKTKNGLEDTMTIHPVAEKDPNYTSKNLGNSMSWEK